MKTLTIRGIDTELGEKIKKSSDERGESINKMVLRLLRSSLGIGEKQVFHTYYDLDHLAGTWTKEEEEDFKLNTQSFDQIDKEMWA